MPITASIAHDTVAVWISSSETTEHLDCCNAFIYDTLLRLFPGYDVTDLKFEIDTKIKYIKGE